MARKLNYQEFEGDMAKSQLQKIEMYAKKLNEMINPEDELEGWVQSKLSRISTDIGDIKHYLDYEIKKMGHGGSLHTTKVQPFVVMVNTDIDEDVISTPKSFKVYADDEDHAVEIAEYMYKPYYNEFEVIKVQKFDEGGMVSPFRMKQAEELVGKKVWDRFDEEEKIDVTNYLINKGHIDIDEFEEINDDDDDDDDDDEDEEELMGMIDIPEDRTKWEYGYKKGGDVRNGMKKIIYKGFVIEISDFDSKGQQQAVAYLNGEPKFGTFSHLDELSAYEKMIIKIDNYTK